MPPRFSALVGALLLVPALLVACTSNDAPATSNRSADGWIALIRDGQLTLVNPRDGGTGPMRPRTIDGGVAWSADGSLISFVLDGEIFGGDAEGRPLNITALAETGGSGAAPVWSPDGTLVAYVLEGEQPGIVVQPPRLSAGARVFEGLAGSLGWWRHPGLAFEQLVAEHLERGEVWVIDRFGQSTRRLFEGRHPVPSPVDGRILFLSDGDLRVWATPDQIATIAASVGEVQRAAWSNDGARIAYANAQGVWVVVASGGVPELVAAGGRSPSWSPNDAEIALERDGTVFTLDLATGEEREVGAGQSPLWQTRLAAAEVTATPRESLLLPAGEPVPPSATTTPALPTLDAGALALTPAFPNVIVRGATSQAFAGGLIDLVAPPGLDRLYAVGKNGTLFTFPNEPEASAAQFLVLPRTINDLREGGLLGLAFDPLFTLNGHFYVYYTVGGELEDGVTVEEPRTNILSRFTVLPNQLEQADPESELVLLQLQPPDQGPNQHNAGHLEFGPDGYLYVSIGDGLLPPSAQDLGALTGSILRIDVSRSSAAEPYRVPDDNPFVATPGARPEIWAYGLRNPWRFTFDPATGDLWAGDVGSDAFEEVDLIVRGGNYGWPAFEGTQLAGATACIQYDCTDMIPPLWTYPHPDGVPGIAVVGPLVYRGVEMPGLQGALLVTDLSLGTVWAISQQDGVLQEVVEIFQIPAAQLQRYAAILAGPDREPYLLNIVGGTLTSLGPPPAVVPPAGEDGPIGVAAAEVLYAQNCAVCHGDFREGVVGPNLSRQRLTEPPETYFRVIREGSPNTEMPAWAETLTDEQITALVNLLLTTDPSE